MVTGVTVGEGVIDGGSIVVASNLNVLEYTGTLPKSTYIGNRLTCSTGLHRADVPSDTMAIPIVSAPDTDVSTS